MRKGADPGHGEPASVDDAFHDVPGAGVAPNETSRPAPPEQARRALAALSGFKHLPTTGDELTARAGLTLDPAVFDGLTPPQIAELYAQTFAGSSDVEVAFKLGPAGVDLQVSRVSQPVSIDVGGRDYDVSVTVPLPPGEVAKGHAIGAFAKLGGNVAMFLPGRFGTLYGPGNQLAALVEAQGLAPRRDSFTAVAKQFGELVPPESLELAFSRTSDVRVAAALINAAGQARRTGLPIPTEPLELLSQQLAVDLTRTDPARFDSLVLKVTSLDAGWRGGALARVLAPECFEAGCIDDAWRLIVTLDALRSLIKQGEDVAPPAPEKLLPGEAPLDAAGLRRVLASGELDRALASALRKALDTSAPSPRELEHFEAMVHGWPLATAEVTHYPERAKAERAEAHAEMVRRADAELASRFPPRENAEQRVAAALGERFAPLAAHPGVRCRLDGFLRFAGEHLKSRPNAKPEHLFDAYSQHLGTAVRYRGLALTEQAAKAILEQGMSANSVRNGESPDAARTRLEREPLKEQVAAHTHSLLKSAALDRSALMSVSDDLPMAAYVARHQVDAPGLQPFVFRIHVPVIELLPYDRYEDLGLVHFAPAQLELEQDVAFDEPFIPKGLRGSSG